MTTLMKRFKSWLVDEIDSISCALRNRFNRRKHQSYLLGYRAGYLQHKHDTDPQTAIDRMMLYGRPGVGKSFHRLTVPQCVIDAQLALASTDHMKIILPTRAWIREIPGTPTHQQGDNSE